MSGRKRLEIADRKREILQAALAMSELYGYDHVSRDDVAEKAECSPSLIPHYFGTMANFRRAIVGEAVRTNNLTILAQALIAQDPRVRNLHPTIREAALRAALVEVSV